MDTERWQRLGELFEAARTKDRDDRDRFLREACAGDTELRARVESLLEHDATELRDELGSVVMDLRRVMKDLIR